jgi:hypothetical protein
MRHLVQKHAHVLQRRAKPSDHTRVSRGVWHTPQKPVAQGPIHLPIPEDRRWIERNDTPCEYRHAP